MLQQHLPKYVGLPNHLYSPMSPPPRANKLAANAMRGIITSLSPNTLHRVAENRAKGLAIRQQKLVATIAITPIDSPNVSIS